MSLIIPDKYQKNLLKKAGFIRRYSRNPIRVLLNKADSALQNNYRAKFQGKPCESCGKPFDLIHHFIEKSQSSGLRFEKRNLIFLCSACHYRHHNTGDSTIHAKIIQKRGIRWLNNLLKLRIERKNQDLKRDYIEKQLREYRA